MGDMILNLLTTNTVIALIVGAAVTAAVAWFKVLFPPLDRLIESLPRRGGTILTWCLVVFMAANMIVSSAALIRYDARLEGVAAQTSLDTLLDEHFDDSYMQRVYPKLVHMN